jgi:hypothetical protein
MSRRRGKGRRRQLWILVLAAADLALGSALYAAHGGGPVALAVLISLVLGVFGNSVLPRRRTRRSR